MSGTSKSLLLSARCAFGSVRLEGGRTKRQGNPRQPLPRQPRQGSNGMVHDLLAQKRDEGSAGMPRKGIGKATTMAVIAIESTQRSIATIRHLIRMGIISTTTIDIGITAAIERMVVMMTRRRRMLLLPLLIVPPHHATIGPESRA